MSLKAQVNRIHSVKPFFCFSLEHCLDLNGRLQKVGRRCLNISKISQVSQVSRDNDIFSYGGKGGGEHLHVEHRREAYTRRKAMQKRLYERKSWARVQCSVPGSGPLSPGVDG